MLEPKPPGCDMANAVGPGRTWLPPFFHISQKIVIDCRAELTRRRYVQTEHAPLDSDTPYRFKHRLPM